MTWVQPLNGKASMPAMELHETRLILMLSEESKWALEPEIKFKQFKKEPKS